MIMNFDLKYAVIDVKKTQPKPYSYKTVFMMDTKR